MTKRIIISLVAAVIAVTSCKMVDKLSDTAAEMLHGEVVARVGDHRLYKSQVEDFIPPGVSAEDSTTLAWKYINTWAEGYVFMDMAEEQLSPEEKDLTSELEDYRRSLLRYRYIQKYVSQRLDTLVTEKEIQDYYKASPEKFRLERPVIKARYMIIPADSRSLKKLKKLMSSDDDNDIREADSLAFGVAIKYVDASDTWMDAVTLAREIGTDYRTLLGSIKNSFAEVKDDAGNLHLAYILEMVPEGKTAPLDYCGGQIKDIILSARRHGMEATLSQELMEDAIKNEKFVIYQ